jgi:hypothetical protein
MVKWEDKERKRGRKRERKVPDYVTVTTKIHVIIRLFFPSRISK